MFLQLFSSLIAGAKEININYCSTSYSSYPEEYCALGATYDLLGDSISTKYINCTNGLSIYCGSIEYRKTSVSQTFAFHEILGVSGKYIMAFSSYLNMSNNIHFEMCNIINNTMVDNNNLYVRPTIIFYQIRNCIISNFTFIRNDFGKLGMIDSVDYETRNIIFINCVASFCPIQAWKAYHITTIDCIIDDKDFETIDLNLHNMVDCKNAFPTENFSDSLDFTQSFAFSDSMAYTPSCVFTPSLFIGQTHFFTQSSTFIPSFDFTHSKSYLLRILYTSQILTIFQIQIP